MTRAAKSDKNRAWSVTLSPCHLVTLSLVLAAGCDPPGKPTEADRPVRPDQVTDFDALYSTRCAGCHGAEGKLGPAPPLNDPLFLAIVPDAELRRVISEGRAVTASQKTPMAAFARGNGGPLTDAQVKALAEGLKKRWPPAAPADAPPYLSPPGSKRGDSEKGAGVFAGACAGCHGKMGEGVERDGKLQLQINNKAFLALISDKALRRIVITGRHDLGMPAYNGKDGRPADYRPLTTGQIDDVVALLASWRQGEPADKK
jgi:cytochrome c oxidase cbb3-type subunit 3/ubiquinol-cytochrome c reductase cytochrome c subunit